MTGKGTIISTNGQIAVVRVQKSSACGHDCGECRLCHNPEIEVEILNTINAKEGDTVLIGNDTSRVLRDAFLLYMMPVIGAIVFYSAVSSVFNSAVYATITAVIYLSVWFVSMRRYSKNKVAMSVALEVVHEKN